ncbi:hypothetical protein AURDEDRAFT_163961 [Auricularia subglabra TFB-10046 SS5]|nr:hypothetical protein AURDEDRAFT_163961 [Auricularia subglabra TFB-10046 SS5]
MPGASSFVPLVALAALYTTCTFSFVSALDVLVPITKKAVGYSNVPLASSKCADFTFNEQCTDNWFFLDKQEGINATMVTWGSAASLSLVFQGSAFELYGRTLPNGATFLASVDGAEELQYDTRSDEELAEVNILLADGLDPTVTHTLDLRYDPAAFSPDPDNRVFLGLDFIIVRNAPASGTIGSTLDANAGATAPGTQTEAGAGTDKGTGKGDSTSLNADAAPEDDAPNAPFKLPKTPNKPLSTVAIAALVSVIGLTLVLAGIALFIYRRRRLRLRKQSASSGSYMFGPQAQAMQEANVAGAGAPTLVESPVQATNALAGTQTPPRRPEARMSPLYPTPETQPYMTARAV